MVFFAVQLNPPGNFHLYTAVAILYPDALATSVTLPREILQAASQMSSVSARGQPRVRFLLAAPGLPGASGPLPASRARHTSRACESAQARDLLRHRNLAVGDIAWRVGLNDTSYFAKLFGENVGMTPLQYRAAVRGKLFAPGHNRSSVTTRLP